MNENKEVQIGKYKVKVLKENCIGAAACVAIAPNVFELDENMKAFVKDNASDTEENILTAAQSCPVMAIVITDIETGEQVWPK